MTIRVDEFIDLFKGGTHASRFRVTAAFPPGISTPSLRQLSQYTVTAATLPGIEQGDIQVPIHGRIAKFVGDIQYQPWQIQIINNQTFDLRDAFERWVQLTNRAFYNTGSNDPNEYMVDLKVEQMTKDANGGERGEVLKTYNFIRAFPTSISDMQGDYQALNTFQNFAVTINYQYWLSNTTVPTDNTDGRILTTS